MLKIYDKGQRVLRIEVKVLNTAALKVGKLLEKLPQMLTRILKKPARVPALTPHSF